MYFVEKQYNNINLSWTILNTTSLEQQSTHVDIWLYSNILSWRPRTNQSLS